MFKIKVTNIVIEESYQFEAKTEEEIRNIVAKENSVRGWFGCCCICEISLEDLIPWLENRRLEIY